MIAITKLSFFFANCLSLVFIGILLIGIKVLWKAKESAEMYSREQDKANLEVFVNLANHLGLVDDKIDNTLNKLDTTHDKLDKMREVIVKSLK